MNSRGFARLEWTVTKPALLCQRVAQSPLYPESDRQRPQRNMSRRAQAV